MTQRQEITIVERIKAGAVPLICVVISIVGGFIIQSVNKLTDEMRSVKEYQIRSEEQIKFMVEKVNSHDRQLEEIKDHIFKWQ